MGRRDMLTSLRWKNGQYDEINTHFVRLYPDMAGDPGNHD